MAEWSIALVLKISLRKRNGGSNPPLSAQKGVSLCKAPFFVSGSGVRTLVRTGMSVVNGTHQTSALLNGLIIPLSPHQKKPNLGFFYCAQIISAQRI